jgi:hypothetical protein
MEWPKRPKSSCSHRVYCFVKAKVVGNLSGRRLNMDLTNMLGDEYAVSLIGADPTDEHKLTLGLDGSGFKSYQGTEVTILKKRYDFVLCEDFA